MLTTYSVYGSYLVFQLFSHKTLYDDNHPDVFRSTKYASRKKKEEAPNGDGTGAPTNSSSIPLLQLLNVHASSIAGSSSSTNEDPEAATEEVEEEKPQMSVPLTIGLLVVVTVVRLLCLAALTGPC